ERPKVNYTSQKTKGNKNNLRKTKSSNYKKRKSGDYTLVFKDEEYQIRSARGVMTKLFKLLSKEDESFLERFASRKHGRKRRYLAKDKYELYPGRRDLAENNSVVIVSNWWMGTNYSRKNIQDIIDLALEVTEPQLRGRIKAKVY